MTKGTNKRAADGRNRRSEQRRVSVRGVRRDPPDLHKISRALAALAIAQVEAEAEAESVARRRIAETQGESDLDLGAAQ